MFSIGIWTAAAIRTRLGAEPPHIPGHVFGYPDPGNTRSQGVPPYCGGEGFFSGKGLLGSRWGGGMVNVLSGRGGWRGWGGMVNTNIVYQKALQ